MDTYPPKMSHLKNRIAHAEEMLERHPGDPKIVELCNKKIKDTKVIMEDYESTINIQAEYIREHLNIIADKFPRYQREISRMKNALRALIFKIKED